RRAGAARSLHQQALCPLLHHQARGRGVAQSRDAAGPQDGRRLTHRPGGASRAATLIRMEAIMAVKKNDPAPIAGATAIEGDAHSVADPAPAAALEDASGAIIEPAITDAVDVS